MGAQISVLLLNFHKMRFSAPNFVFLEEKVFREVPLTGRHRTSTTQYSAAPVLKLWSIQFSGGFRGG